MGESGCCGSCEWGRLGLGEGRRHNGGGGRIDHPHVGLRTIDEPTLHCPIIEVRIHDRHTIWVSEIDIEGEEDGVF